MEVKDPATGKWNKANNYPVKGTTYEVPNLEEGNEYQFRVVAENEAGPGKPSRASEAVIAKDPIRKCIIRNRNRLSRILTYWNRTVSCSRYPSCDTSSIQVYRSRTIGKVLLMS